MRSEHLADGHEWLRIADPSWENPLDPSFAAASGGRWNPPHSFPTLYLNEDVRTARFNLRLFIQGWPYEPEDLLDSTGPVLVHATVPRRQRVADAITSTGLAALGLRSSYPLDEAGSLIPHSTCQPIGSSVKDAGLRGVKATSARVPDRAGRELAWFPASSSSVARKLKVRSFSEWYW
ncbi:MAG: RES family NAD+ phosphorylase [Pseudomonadota bacterium]